MRIEGERILITGGAGFLGRHLARALAARGSSVVIVDRDDTHLAAVQDLARTKGVTIVRGDVRSPVDLAVVRGCSGVFHLAASPDVRAGEAQPAAVFEDNVLATARLLEAMRDAGVSRLLFPSTSTVYGEATVVPTPEDYAPLAPVSVYGASKLAGEGLIHGFAATHALTAVIVRLANVVGDGATHGVVFDLVRKLRANPKELEILGREPGTQKSYVHVDDTIAAMLQAWAATDEGVGTFNVGSEDAITVRELADEVCAAMELDGVAYRWTGGVDGGGWKGDVKTMALAIDRLQALGWRPRHGSAEAVRLAAAALAKT
ncbi:MAG TPA: SDR family NAD(P)-dependent oxidoreductase [Thermoplasmata archaeon]|jgi:UDP-glucose 4-epimerase|nr:SDR family NAD(P)-dependent oxidoreductase [Thermoplasmata archaeon]